MKGSHLWDGMLCNSFVTAPTSINCQPPQSRATFLAKWTHKWLPTLSLFCLLILKQQALSLSHILLPNRIELATLDSKLCNFICKQSFYQKPYIYLSVIQDNMVCNTILVLSSNPILEMGHSKTFDSSSMHTISFRAVSLHLYTHFACRCMIVHSWNCFY